MFNYVVIKPLRLAIDDLRGMIAELLADIQNGDNRNLKKEYQFFATPKELAQKLCSYIPEDTETILEPSAGRGAIIQAINEFNPNIKVSYCELMELNRKQLKGEAEFLHDYSLCCHPE